MPTITDRTIAFSTPWFDIVAKQVDGDASPHYTLRGPDYVTVLAIAPDGHLLLVRQFRPVVENTTLELPSGLMDAGETPETCARRELIEETGHEAGSLECLGALVPDVGRLGVRMWCYVATELRPVADARIEAGIELVRMTPKEYVTELTELRCNHALNFAVIMLAVLKGRFSLD